MPEPLREQILAYAADRIRQNLPGLRPWDGIYPVVPTVRRDMPIGGPIQAAPLVVVAAGSGSALPLQSTVGGGGEADFMHQFVVLVYGYIRGDDATPAATWAQRLQDDIIGLFLQDQRFGELAMEVEVHGDRQDDGNNEGIAGFVQRFLVLAPETRFIG